MIEGLVSIIMPSWNTGRFISDSIRSVVAQTYQNWELLLVDDCSSDDIVSFIAFVLFGGYSLVFSGLGQLMVITNMRNVIISFTSGMEAVFGDMLAKHETGKLKTTFEVYDTGISFVSGLLFSVTTVMILPFVKIYTDGVDDVNYLQPTFAVLLSLAIYYYSVRTPYHYMVIAANHFKQTRSAAYGEALINVVLSVILVLKFGLIGVAVGTLAADLFRYIYYAKYLSMHVIHLSFAAFIKRFLINLIAYSLSCFIGFLIVRQFTITGYFVWVLAGAAVTGEALLIHTLSVVLFYRRNISALINIIMKRKPKISAAD